MLKLWSKLSDEDRIIISLAVLIALVVALLWFPPYAKASAEQLDTASQVNCRAKADRIAP